MGCVPTKPHWSVRSSTFSAGALARWPAAHRLGCHSPSRQRPLQVWEERAGTGGQPGRSALLGLLGALGKREQHQRYLRGARRSFLSFSSFSFLHSPLCRGLRGGAGRLGEGHLRLLFNPTIHVQDRITCIKCTGLLIHLVIKQGITPEPLEPGMTAYFHPLHRWGN